MRNRTVDIVRGIASILVVVGHALAFRQQQGWVVDTTHIASPLFFFLSGVFLTRPTSWKAWLAGKVDALLKPYLVVLSAIGIVYFLFSRMNVWQYVAGVMYATGGTIVLLPLWFLPHLFLSLTCVALLLGSIGRLNRPDTVAALIVPVLLLCAPSFMHAGWPEKGLPFSADLLPLSMAMVLSGNLLARRVRNFYASPVGFCLARFVVVLALCYGGVAIDMNLRVFLSPVFTLFFIVAAAYSVFCLSAWLSRLSAPGCVLAWFGRHSILVLLFHLLWLRLVFRLLARAYPVMSQWHMALLVGACLLLCAATITIVCRIRFLSLLLLPVSGNGREK